ncbi:MAG: SDR family oxidoreductase [Planctomycetota bacterium]
MPTAVVTGANRGIGLEFTRQLLLDGYTVFAACRKPEDAAELQQLAESSDGRCRVVPLDVADEQSCRALPDHVDGAVDLLINNAGVHGPKELDQQQLGGIVSQDAKHVFAVNVVGPMLVTQALLDRLSSGSKVLMLSSGLGSIACIRAGRPMVYAASKAALNMLSRGFGMDLVDRGITCVAIQPGWVRTDMGGPDADISVEESVTAMLATVKTLGPADAGRFIGLNGADFPW